MFLLSYIDREKEREREREIYIERLIYLSPSVYLSPSYIYICIERGNDMYIERLVYASLYINRYSHIERLVSLSLSLSLSLLMFTERESETGRYLHRDRIEKPDGQPGSRWANEVSWPAGRHPACQSAGQPDNRQAGQLGQAPARPPLNNSEDPEQHTLKTLSKTNDSGQLTLKMLSKSMVSSTKPKKT